MKNSIYDTKKLLLNQFQIVLKIIEEQINSNILLSNTEIFNDLKNIYTQSKTDIYKIIDIEKYIYNITTDTKVIEEIKNIIIVLKAFNNNSTLKLPNQTLNEIRNNNCLKKLLEKNLKDMIDIFEKKLYLKDKIEQLITYTSKLDEHDYFDNTDLLMSFMKNSNSISFDYKININSLTLKYNVLVGQNNLNYIPSQEKMIEKFKKNKLTFEQLVEIFNEYGYDVELIKPELINNIAKYGDINNIKYVFEWYKSQEFDKQIKGLMENDESFDIYFILLYKTDKEVIKKMEETAHHLNIPIKNIFKKNISTFIHKAAQKAHIKHDQNNDNEKINNICGCHEDFIKNIELFNSLGYDVSDIYKNCASILTYSNKTISNNINGLKTYGIDIRNNNQNIKLSGLKSANILLTIDQFIELDEFDYVRNNTSRLQLTPDNIIFYKLYYAKRNGEEYRSKSFEGSYKSYITQNLHPDSKVRPNNKLEDTNTIKPVIVDQMTDQKYNDLILDYDYTIDYNLLESDLFKKLDKNFLSQDQMAYQIGNSRFSKLKLARLLSAFDKIDNNIVLYCLTYNSIISQEEFDLVKNNIMSLLNERSYF